MGHTGAGWYDDGSGRVRWWDGQQWTEHVAPAVGYPVPRASTGRSGSRRVWLIIAGGLVLIVAALSVWLWMWVAQASLIGAVVGGGAERTVNRDDQHAARDVVQDFERALSSVDCAVLGETSTAGFRDINGWGDCAAFEADRMNADAGCVAGFEIGRVSAAPPSGGVDGLRVEVIDTCVWSTDEDGAPIEDPYVDRVPWMYDLVRTDDGWRVDSLSDDLQKAVLPRDDEERAAVSAMRAYISAFATLDCAAFQRATTAGARAEVNAGDCAGFEDTFGDYVTSATSITGTPTRIVHAGRDQIEVLTREDSTVDESDGESQMAHYQEYWLYTIVRDGAQWRVDSVDRY